VAPRQPRQLTACPIYNVVYSILAAPQSSAAENATDLISALRESLTLARHQRNRFAFMPPAYAGLLGARAECASMALVVQFPVTVIENQLVRQNESHPLSGSNTRRNAGFLTPIRFRDE